MHNMVPPYDLHEEQEKDTLLQVGPHRPNSKVLVQSRRLAITKMHLMQRQLWVQDKSIFFT